MTRNIALKHFAWPVLFLFCLAAWPCTALASDSSKNTRQDLIQLQNILQKQEQLILAQHSELTTLKLYVSALEESLQKAEQSMSAAENISQTSLEELTRLKEDLLRSSALINQANQELKQLSKDYQKQLNKLKLQRNIWAAAFAVATVYAVSK